MEWYLCTGGCLRSRGIITLTYALEFLSMEQPLVIFAVDVFKSPVPSCMYSYKKAQVFLTNQSLVTFKTLSNLASQLSPPKDVNALTVDEIATFMNRGQH